MSSTAITADYRPSVDRNETNGLSQAEAIRNYIHDLFVYVAEVRQVSILVLKSSPFTSPPWVSVQCWLRHPSDPAMTLRSAVEFYVHPREFHRFLYEIEMVITDDQAKREVRSIIDFKQPDAERILDYLLYKQRSRDFGLRRCRTWPWQLWLPKNKPARLKIDPWAVAAQVLLVLGVLTIAIGVGVIFLLAWGILSYINGKRRKHVLSAGKPTQEPRKLIRLDSWQTLVRGIGTEREAVLAAVQAELGKTPEDGFALANEKIWHWGVDGKEEREQLVARFRRGMAFVQIYRYGNDLFVGWDAHVNCGTWVEQIAGAGYDKTIQELCVVHTMTAGWHVPNEYDISDTNCLLERVHAAVTEVVKLKLAEHKIDQEIDFKIVREPRQNIAGRGGGGGSGATGGIRGALSKIRRVA
jgi:hypothetical protein